MFLITRLNLRLITSSGFMFNKVVANNLQYNCILRRSIPTFMVVVTNNLQHNCMPGRSLPTFMVVVNGVQYNS